MRSVVVLLVVSLVGCRSAPGGRTSASRGNTGERQSAVELHRQFHRAFDDRRYAEALDVARRVAAQGGDVSKRLQARVRIAIDQMTEPALEAAWEAIEPHYPASIVAQRLSLLAEHRGDDASAQDWRARGAHDGRGRPAQVARTTVAVIAPFSGRYAALGAELRAAVEIAVPSQIRLVFLDTQGQETLAADAVRVAVERHRVVGILGPLGRRTSRAAARVATQYRVPIALLASADEGASARLGVFRLVSSPSWRALEVARAASELGWDRIAVFAPRGRRGTADVAALHASTQRFGGKVVRAGYYDPSAATVESDVKRFLGLDPRTNRRLRRHLRRYGKRGWKTFSPDIDFEVLHVPDDYATAALLVSYLEYYNVEFRAYDDDEPLAYRRKHGGRTPQLVQLVGGPRWHHRGLITRGGTSMQGAVVVDWFSGTASDEYTSETARAFALRFRARTGRRASSTAATFYDAARLVFGAVTAQIGDEARPRERVRRLLASAHLQDGVCGRAYIDSAGMLRRSAQFLRVDGGEFTILDY